MLIIKILMIIVLISDILATFGNATKLLDSSIVTNKPMFLFGLLCGVALRSYAVYLIITLWYV